MTNQEEIEKYVLEQVRISLDDFKQNNDYKDLNLAIEARINAGDYKKLIDTILFLEKWPDITTQLDRLKLDWWRSYLSENLSETDNGKFLLIGLENESITFDSLEDVYYSYIKNKNGTIWNHYHKAFTKVLVEFLVDSIVESTEKLSLVEREPFIRNSIIELKKREVKEIYFFERLNENLSYYRRILELSQEAGDKNNEVFKDAFFVISKNDKIYRLKESLKNRNFDDFFKIVESIYSSLPYLIFSPTEAYFHSIFHVILSVLENSTRSEDISNLGRSDTVVIEDNNIFIFEFKLTDSEEAIIQILDKQYYRKYLDLNKNIILVGVAFDIGNRNIKNWKIKNLN